MSEKKGEYVAIPTTDNFPPPPPPPPPAIIIQQPASCNGCSARKERCRKKARRAFKICVGAMLLALATIKVILPALLAEPPVAHIAVSPFDIPHGKGHLSIPQEDLAGFEYGREASEFMGGLNAAFGERGHRGDRHLPPTPVKLAPECCAIKELREQPERPKKHHHRHHKQHHNDDNVNDVKRVERFVTPYPPPPEGCPCGPVPKHDRMHRPGSLSPPPPPPPPHHHSMGHHGMAVRPPPSGSPPHPHFCSSEDELEATSNVFTFSPEQFKRAALYVGSGFPDSGKVFFSKSGEEGSDIKVNVTVLHGSEHAIKATTISAFDHEGQYVVEMKRRLPHGPRSHGREPMEPPMEGQPPHGPPPHNTTELCAKYEIHVVFPADLEEFEDFDLRVRNGQIDSCPSLKTIDFAKFSAGVGRGYINFASLNVQKAKLGVLSGHIRGEYAVSDTLSASVLKGSSDISAVTTGESAKIAVTALHGFAQAHLPADGFEGNFLVHTVFRGEPLVHAPEPTDVHIKKYRHNLKAGYYKAKDTGYKVLVHVKDGDSKLIFN
ncbi:hypothetical protein BDB00DRAFT_873764 [Zychaea mexicana]|uniref:uncharacterized protein n=1 Tax=Zychaea mexicana TaxID=64656 RepID=UPI0022FDD842|nr:uncharacterized protein BDB00DRAFT_873764 [Zychaea mexicana]KAI9491928.1 hypothetical protein BDB00DRAFT_873764 [Zychaea mexicana]